MSMNWPMTSPMTWPLTWAVFISHPEVVIDPATPVPRWHLAPRGIERIRALAPALPGLGSVWASTETKAIEAAGILAAAHGLPVQVHPGLDENDRSATGFLPPSAFQAMADRFFASPHDSVEGWETAAAAQARIVSAMEEVLAQSAFPLAVVGHGGTGTLLWCAWSGVPIDRRRDQKGQGHLWRFDATSRRPLESWIPIDPPLPPFAP